MPRSGPKSSRRKHLIIVLIALMIALIVLLIRAETASASGELHSNVPSDVFALQITAEEYQSAVTTERVMLLVMLALVVLTWYYLKWRPPPQPDDDDVDPSERRHGEREG